MSMWQGHPILAEIRQGFKLRPTQTVDKSAPTIVAEDEDVPQIKYERKTPPPVLYFSQPKAQSKSICRVPQEALNIQHTKHRPISPNILSPPKFVPKPSAPVKNTALLKLGGEIKDRSALLNSIKGGIKLRKAVTVDKSGLILDDEQKAIIAARSGTGTPGSSLSASQETLDSQGYSSLTPPSVHSAEDNESFNSRFSDSESESSYQPPPPPTAPIQKVNICLANAPPPPPPPPMASTSFMPMSAPPPPPPLMPMSFSAPPPPPPPPPSSSSYAAPFSRNTETQERSVAFESEKPWQPKPREIIVKEEPKKADAVFDEESLKVSKEKVEAEIKKGTAASRIAAFAKMAESTGGGAVFPKPLGPLIKNPPKRATESAAPTTKNDEIKSASTKKSEPSEKPKSSSSSKQLITKDEVKIHNSTKDGKVESTKTSKDATKTSSSKSTTSKSTEKVSSDKISSDIKKSSSKSSSTQKTGDSSDKPKSSSSSSKTNSTTTSSSKDKTKTSSSSTKTSESTKVPSATVHPPAKKYSVPITIKTDSELPPPIPKSQPPQVSPSAGKHFKEPEISNNNTNLGPYNYKGKSTPSPSGKSTSSISPNSGSYHTAIGSATSSYSSVPETTREEKFSPVPSIASSSTSPRSTASSGESSKENQSIESPFASRFERGVTQHSRNFEKIRQSFGAKTTTTPENNDANNNSRGNSSEKDSVASSLKKKDSTMATRPTKSTAIPINAPWYNKKDYPENEKSTPIATNKNSSKDPETMNPEEMRENYKFKIDLKKKHPIDIIQR